MSIVRTIVFLVLTVSLVLTLTASLIAQSNADEGYWRFTGNLNIGRYSHTATLLRDGKVLVAGGGPGSYTGSLTSAELYDPATGVWTSTGALNALHWLHTATLLDDGRVLVAGGGGAGTTAEIYDPLTARWTATGKMTVPRVMHTATLLPNGLVLAVAGHNGTNPMYNSAELYNPTADSWVATGSLNVKRCCHTATLLPNGNVLVAGGWDGDSLPTSLSGAELYDPATGLWSSTGSMNVRRYNHNAVLLPNGKVLVCGGDGVKTCELYNPDTGSWTTTGSTNEVHWNARATLLPSGKVLLAGGWNRDSISATVTATAELYDSATGVWTPAGRMNVARQAHTTTLLANGQVLVAAGDDEDNTTPVAFNSAELYVLHLYNALVQPPMSAGERSVFNANRGVVPVKFMLMENDAPTCTLPSATISVTRTAGATIGSIDENAYVTAADSSSNFRIDQSACQYVYNLAASSLGVGTYQVDININGIAVGHAVFALK